MSLKNIYLTAKKNLPDTILLFEVGGFYEAIEADAIIVSDILGTTKTTHNGVMITGFSCFNLEKNIIKIVRAGHKTGIINK